MFQHRDVATDPDSRYPQVQHIDGSVVGAEQAVPLTEAIKAVTVYAAGQIGMQDRLGALEVGKEADFTILEADPYKVATDKIIDIKVSETWVHGQKKHG
jgi:predicted amidohydrolase YtcJ